MEHAHVLHLGYKINRTKGKVFLERQNTIFEPIHEILVRPNKKNKCVSGNGSEIFM